MSINTLIEFDDVSEQVFDNTLLTLLNGKGQLKDKSLSSEILFSNFDTEGELTSKRGEKELALGGISNTAVVLGGVLSFPNVNSSIATYSGITSIVDDFSFRVKVLANVNTVVTDRDLVKLSSNVDASEILFYLENSGGGLTRVKLRIIDSAGTVLNDTVLEIRDLSINPIFDVGFSNDDDGNTLTYINGLLEFTVASPAFDFTNVDFIFSDVLLSSADFDNIQLWNAVINLALGVIAPEDTTLSVDENIMCTISSLLVDEVTLLEIIKEIPDGDELKHFIQLDNSSLYHDAVEWVESDQTLAQSNTVQEIQDNLATLPIVKGLGKLLKVGHVFKSALGYTTPLIESLRLQTKLQFRPDDVGICNVFGTVFDKSNSPVVGAEVSFESKVKKHFLLSNVLVGPDAKAVTDNEGRWAISLIETASTQNTVDAIIDYKDGSDPREFKKLIIPDVVTKKFSDIVAGI